MSRPFFTSGCRQRARAVHDCDSVPPRSLPPSDHGVDSCPELFLIEQLADAVSSGKVEVAGQAAD
jgi:hypothetical protein